MRAEELASCADWLHVTFVGKKLANKDGLFGKSDPFIIIKKGEALMKGLVVTLAIWH